MRVYRTMWLVLVYGLAIVGVGVMFIWSVPAMLMLFGCAAAFVGDTTRRLIASSSHNGKARPQNVLRQVITNSLVGGTATVGLIGLAALLGPWVFLLALLVACGSPYAIRQCDRWLGKRAGRSCAPPQTESLDHADPPEIAAPADPLAIAAPALESPAVFRSLSDVELCRVWRASFSPLQSAASLSQRMRIVKMRQDCLDEFERRRPQELAAWLGSGARAAGDPSSFVIDGDGAKHPPIDWDGLIRGLDM